MRSLDELMELIHKHLDVPLGELWDDLTLEERQEVFNRRIYEYVGSQY